MPHLHCFFLTIVLVVDPTVQLREVKVGKALIRVFTKEELERLDRTCDRAPSGKSITPDERKALAARDRAYYGCWFLLVFDFPSCVVFVSVILIRTRV